MTKKKLIDGCTDFTDFHEIFTDFAFHSFMVLLKQSSALLDASFDQQTDLYIGVGKEGLAPSDIPHVMEVDANLLAEKIKSTKRKKVKVYFDYLPQEDHATVGHQALFNAFRLLYNHPK
jgi:predicted alpha/beta superfamily hydrolase